MKPKRCCLPDCFNCPYKDCRYSEGTAYDTDEIDKELDALIRLREAEYKGHSARYRYNHSEKAKACHERYRQTEKAKESDHRYNTSEKGRERFKRHEQTEKARERKKRYYQSETYQRWLETTREKRREYKREWRRRKREEAV